MQWLNLILFLLLSSGLFSLLGVRMNDFLVVIFDNRRKVTLSDELDVLLGMSRKGFFGQSYELEQMLAATGRSGKFETLKRLALILAAVGAVLALLLDNPFMVPVLGAGMAFIPIWYIRSTAGAYKKHLNEELETAISTVTTSYLRTDNILQAVAENISYMQPPIKSHFEEFLTESEMLNANMVSAINTLKMKIPNRIFHEWANTLIQCQADRTMKQTLPSIVQKFSAVRIVQAELDAIISGPRREAITMMFLVICNVPLLYFLNKDWFHTLIYTTPGKLAMALCGGIILFALAKIMKLSKPVEYGG